MRRPQLGEPILRYYSAWHCATVLCGVLQEKASELWPRDDPDLSKERVSRTPKPSDRPESFAVHEGRSLHDVKLGIQTNPPHLAEYQSAGIAEVHMFVEFTFEDRRTIRDVWRVDRLRFCQGQSGEGELITFRRQAGSRPVHRFELSLRDDVHAEGTLVKDVAE